MTETRYLEPHAPLPEGKSVTVLRRFAEEEPDRTIVELVVAHGNGRERNSLPRREDGSPMEFKEAVTAAQALAREMGVAVSVIDRTAGDRERDILAHDGDHGAGMANAVDMDLEDGERGADYRR